MSAFVPRYEFDVFISYAHVDNEPLIDGDPTSRWVRTFVRNLQKQLDRKLGRKNAAKIWFDERELPGHVELTREIDQAIRCSATLLVIMSEGYLTSPWCGMEREAFMDEADDPKSAKGRIFVVHQDDVPLENRPKSLSGLLGYSFYEEDRDTGLTRTLADPVPDASEKEYYRRLNKLRVELAAKLKEIKEGSPPEIEPPAVPAGEDTHLKADSTVSEPEWATVYLAEVTDDLLAVREQIESHLNQSGLRVVPRELYDRDRSQYQEALDRDLSEVILFVQPLGPSISLNTADLPHGYEGLQVERARAASKPILRWRARDLDLDDVEDDQHRRFLSEPDVVATELVRFKKMVVDHARRHCVQKSLSKVNGDRFVLVNVTESDIPLAESVGNQLTQSGIGYDIIEDKFSVDDVTKQNDYDALLAVYGACPQQWVQDRVRQFRRVAQTKKHAAPACAVYVGPPDPKEPLRCYYPKLMVIAHGDPPQFQTFIEAIL